MSNTSSMYGACEGGELSMAGIKSDQVTVYLSGDLSCPCSAMIFRNGQATHEVIEFLQRACQTRSVVLEDNHGRRVEDGKVGQGCLFYTFRIHEKPSETLLLSTGKVMGRVVKVRVMEGMKLGEEVNFQVGDYCADVVHTLRRVCHVRSGVLKDSAGQRLEPQHKVREDGIYRFYPNTRTADEWTLLGTIESLCSWIEGSGSTGGSGSSSGGGGVSNRYSSSDSSSAVDSSVAVASDRRPLLEGSL